LKDRQKKMESSRGIQSLEMMKYETAEMIWQSVSFWWTLLGVVKL